MKQKELEKQQREEADRQRQAAEEAKRKEAMELLSMSMGYKVTGTIFSPWTEFYTLQNFRNDKLWTIIYGVFQTARAHERKGKRALDKERKKKVLTERRKVMNIDHLGREKLIDKLHEIHDW